VFGKHDTIDGYTRVPIRLTSGHINKTAIDGIVFVAGPSAVTLSWRERIIEAWRTSFLPITATDDANKDCVDNSVINTGYAEEITSPGYSVSATAHDNTVHQSFTNNGMNMVAGGGGGVGVSGVTGGGVNITYFGPTIVTTYGGGGGGGGMQLTSDGRHVVEPTIKVSVIPGFTRQ
jgi:hypothetical protein